MKLQIKQFRSSYMSWRKGDAKGARGQAKDVVRTQRLPEKPDTALRNKFRPRLGLGLADLPSSKFAVGPPSMVPVPAAKAGAHPGEGGDRGDRAARPPKREVWELHHRDRRRIAAEKAGAVGSRAKAFGLAGQTAVKPTYAGGGLGGDGVGASDTRLGKFAVGR